MSWPDNIFFEPGGGDRDNKIARRFRVGASAVVTAIKKILLRWKIIVIIVSYVPIYLLALSGSTSPSVIRIRIEGLKGETAANLIRTFLIQCEGDLKQGAVVTVEQHRIRIRKLPLNP